MGKVSRSPRYWYGITVSGTRAVYVKPEMMRAFRAGYEAGKAGQSESDNPYKSYDRFDVWRSAYWIATDERTMPEPSTLHIRVWE